MNETVRSRLNKQKQAEDEISSLRTEKNKLQGELEALTNKIEGREDEKPNVVQTGLFRTGGASGETSAQSKWSDLQRDCDWREYLHAGELPVESINVTDEMLDGIDLPDLRKNGFKGRLTVDTSTGEVLQYESPEEIRDKHHDPDRIDRLVEAGEDDVNLSYPSAHRVLSLVGESDSFLEEHLDELLDALDELDVGREEFVEAIAEEARSVVADVNSRMGHEEKTYGKKKPTRVERIFKGRPRDRYQLQAVDDKTWELVTLGKGEAIHTTDITHLLGDERDRWPRRVGEGMDGPRARKMVERFLKFFPDGEYTSGCVQFASVEE